MAENAKERLVGFLERKAFRPVLGADPDSFPQDKRNKLRDVQEATRAERERFHNYGSAKEVYEMFEDDLNSEPAQKIHRELRDLDLPTLNDCREDFEKLAEEVGVRH
ncbi:hypothetical protein [Chelativorans sp. AA-79]|uniref:hypothetical protein n=1 Tax=Chelativorans sp. AA-79 TaxID=3028735 RepID=UPI0023F6B919|nr:hypothetical protein [Chelativorans sp. AA-79]WEX09585.1 hypothetical protein PVE73_01010 [Chelativorans sp. AA-79]